MVGVEVPCSATAMAVAVDWAFAACCSAATSVNVCFITAVCVAAAWTVEPAVATYVSVTAITAVCVAAACIETGVKLPAVEVSIKSGEDTDAYFEHPAASKIHIKTNKENTVFFILPSLNSDKQ
jgi:hypothetical protein